MVSLAIAVVALSTTGGLLSERAPVAGLLVGAASLDVPYENMSLSQLRLERERLVESMPSPGLGIALTAIGGGVFLVGFTVFLIIDIIVGIIIMVVAAPLLVIGPILLFGALRERRETGAQVRFIDQRMAQLKRDENAPPPVNDVPLEVPPPPPMRPPGSELTPSVEPQLLLATF